MTTSEARRSEHRAQILRLIKRFNDTVLWRWLLRLLEVEFLDRSTAIAAKAFVAVIPLIAVIIIVLPDGVENSWVMTQATALGLSTEELSALGWVESAPVSIGLLGGALLIFYSTSFGTSIQRLYRRAWRRPASAVANRLKVLQWLGAFVLYVLSIAYLWERFPEATAHTLAFIAGAALWTWTGRILLGREVRWRALWLGGFLTQVGLSIYTAATLVLLPQALNGDGEDLGVYGASITVLSWLIGSAFIIVIATALPPVVAEKGNRISSFLTAAEPLEPNVAASLPPPAASPLSKWWSGASPEDE